MDDFQFTTKKMGNGGSLFDIDKLKDVSKNTISVMERGRGLQRGDRLGQGLSTSSSTPC